MRGSGRGFAVRSRLSSAAGLFGAVLMLAPPPVSAGDWDDDDGGRVEHGHRHGHRHDHYDRRGDWCPPRHGPPPGYGYWGGGYDRPDPPRYVEHARYYCEPCGRWYDDEDDFHYHVRHHHHVAEAVIPLVLGAAVFGWVFWGH